MDAVDHRILADCTVLACLNTLLNGVATICHSIHSSTVLCVSGVQQGSVLGTRFFLSCRFFLLVEIMHNYMLESLFIF